MGKRNKTCGSNHLDVYVGPQSSLEGVLIIHGNARIDGGLKGSVRGDGHLTVGPTAKVEADIAATTLVVAGRVEGDVTASQSVFVQKTGYLVGNLRSPQVTVEEGALVMGNVSMGDIQENLPQGIVPLEISELADSENLPEPKVAIS